MLLLKTMQAKTAHDAIGAALLKVKEKACPGVRCNMFRNAIGPYGRAGCGFLRVDEILWMASRMLRRFRLFVKYDYNITKFFL